MMSGRRIGIALCFVVLVSILWATLVNAQEQGNWSSPYRLSSAEGDANEGIMLSDQFGFTHVFWTEENLPDDRSAIQYARFDGINWSTPVDILAARPGNQIESVSAVVDQYGRMHIVWTEGVSGPTYYSSAPAHDALSAKRWSSPRRTGIPAYQVKLRIDSENVFHIVYSDFFGTQPGLYYTRSDDQGRTWSEPDWLDPDILPNHSPFWIDFELGDSDSLHIVWNYVDPESGLGRWVRYTHSLDGGKTWSLPFTIDESDESEDELRMANPGLAIQGQNVYVVWAGDSQTHREFRFSTDSGQTWSVPVRIFGGLHGQAIGDGLAIDAVGRLHFIGQIRYPQGLYHAYWDRNYWSVPSMSYLIAQDAYDDIGNRVHAHHVRLTIHNGNQLVTTFTNSPGEEGQLVLYAMHRVLDDVSPLGLVPTPEPTFTPTPPVQPSSTPTSPTITPPRAPLELGKDAKSFVAVSVTPTSTLLLALAPALLLAGGVVVFQLLYKR